MTTRKPNEDDRILNVHIDTVHIHVEQAANPQIAEILSAVKALTQGARAMATDLTELTAKVEENSVVDQSAIALLEGLKAQLDAAGTDPEQLAALSQALGDSSAALAAAVTANTPAGL